MTSTGWQTRHNAALMAPQGPEEARVVSLLDALRDLSKAYASDYVMRPAVAHLALGLEALLTDGRQLGRLDPGCISRRIHEACTRIGFDPDMERWTDSGEPL